MISCEDGLGWIDEYCFCHFDTPIIIDVSGDGFELTNPANGVLFDFEGNGKIHRLSWTSRDSDDAFLVLDRNNNGTIDNGSELFGNLTAQPTSAHPNGFLALAEYDKPENGGNGDGRIDASDAVYSLLRMWQDQNHDGVSQAHELHPLAPAGITRIDLDYKESKRRDRYGNGFRYRSKLYDETGAHIERWACDVFLLRE